MSQPTYKRTMSGSLGSGMKSLFGGEGRRFYTLEHKVSSKYHKAGEAQRIIVDQIEIGRSSTCQVRFDDSFVTVSAKHAAIVKDGDNWKLIHLSKTNPTYLNGHRVEKEWYLQNGDEIQLATNGPKLGFIIPQGDKGLVKSIGLTARLNLFRQQALRPYKQAITALSCVFIAAIGVSAYFIADAQNELAEQRRTITAYEEKINDMAEENRRISDEMETNKAEYERRLMEAIDDLGGRMDEIDERVVDIDGRTLGNVSGVNNELIEECIPYVYFIMTEGFEICKPDCSVSVISSAETGFGWTGTGFMLDNGKFVTARHVAEGWYFWNDPNMDNSDLNNYLMGLNMIANSGGKVIAHFAAYSSASSDPLRFTSEQFQCNRTNDVQFVHENGYRLSRAMLDYTDYAYFNTNQSGAGLKYDSEKSNTLERGTDLTVLGFPYGFGANAENDINPVYGSGTVACEGLNQGVILTTDTNYEQGNSGGPAFYYNGEGELVVVGIVSAGTGRTLGFLVPISAIE